LIAKPAQGALLYIWCVRNVIGGNGMNVTTTETKKTVKSAFNDEFESYLKKQQIKTTFNGSELESFSWYRKALGLA
jgi:hypothetical protein